MADQMGPPFYKCIQPMCWKDVNGSGIITGEPLTDHITPNTVIRLPKSDFSGAKIGDITLYREESRPNLTSAVLKTTTYGSGGGWTRDITGPQDDDSIPFGYMTMGRPVPDPDTHFNSFAQDLLKAGIPAGLRPAVGPASLMPSPTGSCEPEPSKCLLVVPSADVFYFGPEPTNTACLSTITTAPSSPTPPQVTMDPSSVYVVYQSPQIYDNCRRLWVAIDGPPVTMSYKSEMMSTLEYRSNAPLATKTLDFADLPCPPSNVAEVYNSGAPYFPILVSTFGARWNPHVSGDGGPVLSGPICDIAAIRDPPVRAHRVDKISGPKDDSDTIV